MNSSAGEALRQMRLRKGLTTKELAKQIGLSEQTIEYLERGKRKSINDATLLKLATFWKMDVIEFERFLEQPEPKPA